MTYKMQNVNVIASPNKASAGNLDYSQVEIASLS